jgi:hypothetical protein
MITTGARAFMFAAVICGGMLAACDDSPDADSPSTVAKPAAAPKVVGLDPDMVAAVSSGKTAAALSVHFAVRTVPAIDRPLTVDIAIVPHRDFTSVRGHFESRDGLPMTSGELFGPRTDSVKERALTHEVVMQPTKDGLFMITAIIETEGEDGTITRVFSIPVIVNPPDQAPTKTPVTNAAPAAAASPAAN